MLISEQTRDDALYAQHLTAFKLQGKAKATIDSYAHAIRRLSAYLSYSLYSKEIAYFYDLISWYFGAETAQGLLCFEKSTCMNKKINTIAYKTLFTIKKIPST